MKKQVFKPIADFSVFYESQKLERMKIVDKLKRKIKLDKPQLKRAIKALLTLHEK